MERKVYRMIVGLLITLLLASCSQTGNDTPKSKDEAQPVTNDEKEPEQAHDVDGIEWEKLSEAGAPPTTAAEIVEQPVGEFAGKTYDENAELFVERLKELPELLEVEEEKVQKYWNTVYSLFAEDFTSPQDLIDSWKAVSFGSPDLEDARYQFKEQFNVEIILDASGSMAGAIGNKSKMEIAKEAIQSFTASLPEGTNIGLRVYGHKGTGSDSDKALSCGSTELVYPIGAFDEGSFDEALNRFAPAGWTPIALALDEAAKDLAQYPGDLNTNIIYLVSDGIATCDDDPVQSAKKIAESNIEPIVNVIGFDVDAKGQNQLKEVAKAAGGIYSNANSQDQLQNELDKAKGMAQKWEEWKSSATNEAQSAFHAQFFDAMDFSNDWGETNQRQSRNIWYTLSDLKDSGHISQEVYNHLDKVRRKHFDIVVEEGNKVYQDLQLVNKDNYQEMLKQIEDKYQSQGS